jgi:hypothetical protein
MVSAFCLALHAGFVENAYDKAHARAWLSINEARSELSLGSRFFVFRY